MSESEWTDSNDNTYHCYEKDTFFMPIKESCNHSTYPFDVLKWVGAVVSAIIAALLRYQKLNDRRDRIIAAVDELPTVGLRNVEEYLSTVGGYGITLLLYVQSYSQLASLYGERSAETILSNCQNQLWYPPADEPTAKRMSILYGSDLEPMQSYSDGRKDKRLLPDMGDNLTSRSVNWQVRPALTPEALFALDREEVILRYDRRYVMKGYRLWPVPQLKQLPPPAFEVEYEGRLRLEPHWVRKTKPHKKAAPPDEENPRYSGND